VNVQDEWDYTHLHGAAGNGRVKIVQMLIDAGARKDIPNKDGKFPYDLAQTEEIKDMLKA
jgi:ankyrin repeat protein